MGDLDNLVNTGTYGHGSFGDPGFLDGDSCGECSTGPTFAMPGGNVYFLANGGEPNGEGPFANASAGPRPGASPTCQP